MTVYPVDQTPFHALRTPLQIIAGCLEPTPEYAAVTLLDAPPSFEHAGVVQREDGNVLPRY